MEQEAGHDRHSAAIRDEWRAHWAAPFLAMLGISGATIFPYCSGLLLEPITRTFGWTRSEYSAAFLLQVILGLITAPLCGRLIDRHGPRRVILISLPLGVAGFCLLSLVGQNVWTWWLLVVVLGVAIAPLLPVGWISEVVNRFDRSRGVAIAISLAGVGVGGAIWPSLGALIMTEWGWRAVFPVIGIAWGAVVFPLAWLVLARGRKAAPRHAALEENAASLGQVLRSPTFILLTAAGGVFIAVMFGFNLHLVPILRETGYSLQEAAAVAGLAGIAAIAGRLITGFLLDKLPTRPLAVAIFLLPLATIELFVQASEPSWTVLFAVVLLGLVFGAESDIVTYVASRQFAKPVFASAYAVTGSVLSLATAAGPMLVSMLYDYSHSYRLYFLVAIPFVVLGAALILMLPDRAGRYPARSPADSE